MMLEVELWARAISWRKVFFLLFWMCNRRRQTTCQMPTASKSSKPPPKYDEEIKEKFFSVHFLFRWKMIIMQSRSINWILLALLLNCLTTHRHRRRRRSNNFVDYFSVFSNVVGVRRLKNKDENQIHIRIRPVKRDMMKTKSYLEIFCLKIRDERRV